MMKTLSLTLVIAGTMTASANAVDAPFDVPWIGYDTAVYPQGLWPVASQSADFNGDGFPDLATAGFGGTPWMTVLLADGLGGYFPPTAYATELESEDLCVADFDGDGDIDIVLCDTDRFWTGQTVSLWTNDGAGAFSLHGSYFMGNSGPSGITAADFNNDGWVDVATANDRYIECNNTVSVLLNNGGNGFSGAQVYTIASCTNDIASGDLDGDGNIDLVIGHETNRFSILWNDGETGFVSGPVVNGITAGSIPQEPVVHVADVDLDGALDIFFSNRDAGGVGNGATGLWRNDGAGNFATPETLSFQWYNGGAIDVQTADVTGDGWPDVICATGGSGNWFLFESDGTGHWGAPRKLRAGHNPSAIDTPDLDQDGDLDIMVLGTSSLEACVYLNPGDGAFVQPDAIDFADASLSPAFTTNIESGDIDGDGDLDLLLGVRSDFENWYGFIVRRNNGDGTFAPREMYQHFAYPEFIRLADLDNDDDLDVIWVENDGRFRMRYNDGAGNFGSFVNSTTIGLGGFFDLHDIDADGDLDVVAAGGFDIEILRNNGSGLFLSPLSHDVGGFFNNFQMGDFNNDGHLDLLTNSAPQGYPQIAFGNGDGTFGQSFTVATGRDVHSMAAADFDGDGNLDFASIYNLDEKGLTIRMGRGDGSFFLPDHYHGSHQSDDYTLGGRTEIIDVDGDGHLDVLFANVKAQDVSFWKGNGDGTFQRLIRCGAGHNVHDMTAGDFDGDGLIDVVMSANIDNGRWWYAGAVMLRGVDGDTPPVGDITGDGLVDVNDLLAMLGDWGACVDCPADLDGDGDVDVDDLLILLANWS